MASSENGLAAVAYGPCVVDATVGDGVRTRIFVETDYPFNETVALRMEPEEPVEFPLALRIPGWAEGATIRTGDEEHPGTPETFFNVERVWSPGDRVEIRFPMKVRSEKRYNDAVTLLRGPVVYSLRIGEYFHRIAGEAPHADWEVYPTTDWNYGLVLDPKRPDSSIQVSVNEISKVPFSNEAAPVTLQVKGKRIPHWFLKDNSADEPPSSPVRVEGESVPIELIPYGCARLRITEFPVVK
jgi:hypothetical protein